MSGKLNFQHIVPTGRRIYDMKQNNLTKLDMDYSSKSVGIGVNNNLTMSRNYPKTIENTK